MKKLFGHLYDQPGACPECGRMLRPVRYYTGVEGSKTNLGSRQISRGTKQYNQTSYSVNYTDIREHRAGFCDACDRAEWDAKESSWPAPRVGWLIGAIAGAAALAGGILLLTLTLRRSVEGLASKNMGGVFVLLLIGGVFALFGCGGSYMKKRKSYRQHKAGYRAPYVPKTEAQLSDWAKNRARPNPSDGRMYWNLTEFETMQRLGGRL